MNTEINTSLLMCKKMKLLQTYSFPQAISIDYPNHVFFEFKFFFLYPRTRWTPNKHNSYRLRKRCSDLDAAPGQGACERNN